MKQQPRRVAVIDVGSGNVPNVVRALEFLGHSASKVTSVSSFQQGDFVSVVLPGVGHFDHVANAVIQGGWEPVIRQWIDSGGSFLGICVGHQVMARSSEEGNASGLALIDSVVLDMHTQCRDVKIPHMGWNKIKWLPNLNHPLADVPNGYAYFVHTFAIAASDDPACVAVTEYGGFHFSAVSKHGSKAFSMQFHPEKSGAYGLGMLNKVVSL